jgi:dihydrofolate reductase
VHLKIRGFIAASLDGYVASTSGSVDFLQPFESVDYGYDAFIASVDTVILGRKTYDQIPSFGVGWPYTGKQGVVVTSSSLDHTYPDVQAWHGDVQALARQLRARNTGDAWVVGGAQLQSAFIAAGCMDQLDLFIVPVMLGDGVPLFPRVNTIPVTTRLITSTALDKGMVRLVYALTDNT